MDCSKVSKSAVAGMVAMETAIAGVLLVWLLEQRPLCWATHDTVKFRVRSSIRVLSDEILSDECVIGCLEIAVNVWT